MSNMVTWLLPPNTGRSLSSALMARRFLESCRPFRLMYAQIFLVTSVRGMALLPTTAPSAASGCMGFMNAALGVRFLPVFLADLRAVVLRAGFRAVFLADFLVFFLVAIACLPVWVRTVRAAEPAELPRQQYKTDPEFPRGKWPFSEGKWLCSPEKARFSPGNL